MSENESFIDEVTEEVRRDKLYLLLKKYGWIGVVAIVEDLLSNAEIASIVILIIGSSLYIWISIKLSEQVIFYIGGLGLIINLPRLITELLPDNIWPPLILFVVGGVLVTVGLYLNTLRENIKKIS